MYFADLTLLTYHAGSLDASCWQSPLLAVGWLEHPHPYSTGTRQLDLQKEIQGMVGRAKTVHPHESFRGFHRCSLCDASGHGREILLGSNINLLIPGEGVIYAAPAAITHYLEHHFYLPPACFVAAVEECPEYGTPVFFDALRKANKDHAIPLVSWEEHLRVSRAELQKAVEAGRQRSV